MPGEPARTVAPPQPAPVPAPEPPPRVWTVLVAYALVAVGSILASLGVVFAVVLVRAAQDPGLAQDAAAAEALFRATLESSEVLFASALVTAAVQVGAALSGGWLSRERFGSRLALRRPRLGAAAFAVAAVGCVAVSSTFDAAFGALGLEPTGSIAELGKVLAGLSRGGIVIAVAVAGVAAPVAEELFFRGYVQTRLRRRWGTWAGIAVTAALFGLIHFDWIHSPSAFLIGLYLGWLAARGGSIAPAVAAHAVNNALWAVATWAGIGTHLSRGTHAALLVASVALAVAAIYWLRPRLAAATAVAGPPLSPGGLVPQ